MPAALAEQEDEAYVPDVTIIIDDWTFDLDEARVVYQTLKNIFEPAQPVAAEPDPKPAEPKPVEVFPFPFGHAPNSPTQAVPAVLPGVSPGYHPPVKFGPQPKGPAIQAQNAIHQTRGDNGVDAGGFDANGTPV